MAKGQKTGGRRTKLTPEIQEKIVSAIRAGNYANVAAEYAGIGERTFYRWLERGREANRGIYWHFWQAVKKAEREAEVRAVAIIQKHMEGNWQAAMTYLERKFPQRWSRRDRLEHTGADGGPIRSEQQLTVVDIPYDKLTIELRRQMLKELEETGELTQLTTIKMLRELEEAGEHVLELDPSDVKLLPEKEKT